MLVLLQYRKLQSPANARYERGAMILTSNRGFSEWGHVFGDTVVATALLDRLLHHATLIRFSGDELRLLVLLVT